MTEQKPDFLKIIELAWEGLESAENTDNWDFHKEQEGLEQLRKFVENAIKEHENVEKVKQETINDLRREIVNAYNTRDDYPPFALTSFEDRPRYHKYILKLLDEMEKET